MPTELAPTVADDSTLPRFAVPSEVRQWGARVHVAQRSAPRVAMMLSETVLLYAAFVTLGETIDRWYGWVLAWIGLVMCMMRVDAVHHEAVHRSLFGRRWANDVVAGLSGAIEGSSEFDITGDRILAFWFAGFGYLCGRRDGYPAIGYGNAELIRDLVRNLNQFRGVTGDFAINFLIDTGNISGRAVPEGNSERDGANVEILHLGHRDRLEYLVWRKTH